MNSVLVTGGAGFIGSHTCIQLLKDGKNVFIVDSLINSSETAVSNIKKVLRMNINKNHGKLFFKKGDLRDKNFSKIFSWN